MNAVKTMLHPTDFSACARAAFEIACDLARAHQARLIVLHVVPAHEPIAHYAKALGLEPPEEAKTDLKGYQEEMGRMLRRVVPADPKIAVEHLLKEGAVAKTIAQTANEANADLLVLGTRGQSKPGKTFFGSVAEEVCRTAGCTVVTVQPKG